MVLELNTQAAASLFTSIGGLEADLDSKIGKQLARRVGELGKELAMGSNEHARRVSLELVDELTQDAAKPTIYLSLEREDEEEAE